MGFLDFLKTVGGGIMSGIGKVAGVVGKIAPVVSKIAGAIPTPFTQGIASAANAVGGVANVLNGGGLQGVAQGTPVAGVVNQAQGIAQAVAPPPGTPVM
jgi:hypothetical protein